MALIDMHIAYEETQKRIVATRERQLAEAVAEVARLRAENGRLREALDIASHYIDCLEASAQRRKVRDMTEAMEAWHREKAALQDLAPGDPPCP